MLVWRLRHGHGLPCIGTVTAASRRLPRTGRHATLHASHVVHGAPSSSSIAVQPAPQQQQQQGEQTRQQPLQHSDEQQQHLLQPGEQQQHQQQHQPQLTQPNQQQPASQPVAAAAAPAGGTSNRKPARPKLPPKGGIRLKTVSVVQPSTSNLTPTAPPVPTDTIAVAQQQTGWPTTALQQQQQQGCQPEIAALSLPPTPQQQQVQSSEQSLPSLQQQQHHQQLPALPSVQPSRQPDTLQQQRGTAHTGWMTQQQPAQQQLQQLASLSSLQGQAYQQQVAQQQQQQQQHSLPLPPQQQVFQQEYLQQQPAAPQQQQQQQQPSPQPSRPADWWKTALQRHQQIQQQQRSQRQQQQVLQDLASSSTTTSTSSTSSSNGSSSDSSSSNAQSNVSLSPVPASTTAAAEADSTAAAAHDAVAIAASAPVNAPVVADDLLLQNQQQQQQQSRGAAGTAVPDSDISTSNSSVVDGPGSSVAAVESQQEQEQQQQQQQPQTASSIGYSSANRNGGAASIPVLTSKTEPDASTSSSVDASSTTHAATSSSSSSSSSSSVADAPAAASTSSRRRRRSSSTVSRSTAAEGASNSSDSNGSSSSRGSSSSIPSTEGPAVPTSNPASAAAAAAAGSIGVVESTADGSSSVPEAAATPGHVTAGPDTSAASISSAASDTSAANISSAAGDGPALKPKAAASHEVPQAAGKVRRRAQGSSSSSNGSSNSTTVSAASWTQMLSGQRSIAAAKRRTPGAVSGGSRSSKAASLSSSREIGDIVQKHGQWVMTGFLDDKKALDSLIPALQQRLKSAVEAEQQHEAAAIKALYARGSLRNLQRDGLVLLELSATPDSVLYSSMVWRFTASGSQLQQSGQKRRELPHHRFRQGDNLLISRYSEDQLVELSSANSHGSNSSNGNNSSNSSNGRRSLNNSGTDLSPAASGFKPLDATVLEVRKDYLLLAVDKPDSDIMQEVVRSAPAAALVSWRLDQSVRDTTARRQLDAIKRLHQPATDSPFEALLRKVLLGTPNASYMASLPPQWVRHAGWRQDVRELLDDTQGLNKSQKRAIAQAVVRSFTLWQGPPGTGKTRTLLALVEVLVKAANRDSARLTAMGPILACADTNAAVDNLVEGLLNKGLRVVRLGQPAKVRDNLRRFTLEAQAEGTPDGRTAARLRQASKDLFERAKQASDGSLLGWSSNITRSSRSSRSSSGRPGGTSSSTGGSSSSRSSSVGVLDSESLDRDARRKWAEAERLTRQAAQQVLREAQVVCATCAGAGDPLLNNLHFNLVVIDEATQATEPATLVPLTQGAQCVVMAGDPCQLPPTITSNEALRYDLAVTLFERLQKAAGLETLLLDTQYRMNPAISQFPSHWFYQGLLKDGVTAEQKPPAAGLSWPQPQQPVMVVAVQGREEKAEKNGRKVRGSTNTYEGGSPAPLAAPAAASAGLMEQSYRNVLEAQVALQAVYALMSAGDAASAAILTPYKGQVRAFEHALRVLSPWIGPELQSVISVSSVDGYQGREADVIVFSAVRCNPSGHIGFLSDPRRLNVAITRPRRGLVVVGSPQTLSQRSKDWREFMEWCEQKEWIVGPETLPAAPWQLKQVDPFDPATYEGASSPGSSRDSM